MMQLMAWPNKKRGAIFAMVSWWTNTGRASTTPTTGRFMMRGRRRNRRRI